MVLFDVNAFSWLAFHEPDVEQELFLLGYRNLSVHALGLVCLPLLVCAGAWSTVPQPIVWAWLIWMLAMSFLFRYGLWLFRHKVKLLHPDLKVLRQWHWANLGMISMGGFSWGCIGFLFVPEAQVNNLMVMTSFAGVLAYTAISNVYDMRGLVGGVLLGTAALSSQIPYAFGAHASFVIGMCLLYMAMLGLVTRNAHRTLLESIRLRLSNQLLAQKNAENAARAEQANRDKSEFLAAASHDLRQPVHALLLLIEAYRQQVPAAANHPLLHHIAVAGQSISSLFNALMELSRLESGTEKPVLESFDLADVLLVVLNRTRPQAEGKNLRLQTFQAKRLTSRTVCTDRLLLQRILGNLLSNAVRYTTQGGVLLSLRPAHGDDGLWLEVWDTGQGIALADQTRIFDPYVQIGNRERDRTKGLGLGLAIVRHAAHLLGLRVSLHSKPDRGSCFRLHLPGTLCQPDRPEPAQSDRGTSFAVVHAPQLAGRRVLLVDDDPMVLLAMQALLGSWKVDLRCANRGDESVFLLCSPDWAPECVLSDFRLPGPLNGIALLDELLDHYPHAVGILQTGELREAVQTQAQESGYLVLFKPIDPAKLAATLSAVLDCRTHEKSL